MLRESEVEDGYVLCPECEGAQQTEQIKGYPNRDGGNTEWVDCDYCGGAGQVEDDRPVCDQCGERMDEDDAVEMEDRVLFCRGCYRESQSAGQP